jgi:RHS repeat-associated protein
MYYYVRNGQSDIIGILNSAGTSVVSYTYDSWGNPISTTGTSAATIGVDNPFRYRGYYFDSETGLFYVGSRYYDPVTSRYLNADDTDILTAQDELLGKNLFAYCTNNPVNNSDDTGYWKLPNWAKVAIGVVAVVAAVTLTAVTGGALAPLLIGVAASTMSGAAIGAATGGVQGAIDGACDGFMWGGIFAFVSSAVGAIKFATSAKGAVQGTQKLTTLKPGTQLDRYGSLSGKYLTDAGTSVSKLALPPRNTLVKTSLQVMKPLKVISGQIAQNFGGPGGGMQYVTRYGVDELIKKGFLTIIP